MILWKRRKQQKKELDQAILAQKLSAARLREARVQSARAQALGERHLARGRKNHYAPAIEDIYHGG